MARTRTTAKTATPIERTTLAASAFDQLISYVVNGDWKAGDRIPPERELCQQLGIARTSLREALKAMELVGMLDSRVGDGTFVCPRSDFLARPLLWAFTGTDHEELRDILEARNMMERDLAGLAAERGTEEEIRQIGNAVEMMRKCIATHAPCGEAEMAFHRGIANAANNAVLKNAMQLLLNLMKQWIYLDMRSPAERLKRHSAIYQAILSRDVEAAREQSWQHGLETVSAIGEFLNRQGTGARRKRRVSAG
jgi:GntR family transcriptional regulator, transcriptional repressor for pyruvate dehydrogenase complex